MNSTRHHVPWNLNHGWNGLRGLQGALGRRMRATFDARQTTTEDIENLSV